MPILAAMSVVTILIIVLVLILVLAVLGGPGRRYW